MFNSILQYRFVQRNRNWGGRETWLYEDIYKFFIHSPSSRRKYLVEVHAYPDHLYTVDFYAKVHDVNRYRLRTNQRAMGRLGPHDAGHPGHHRAGRPPGPIRVSGGGYGTRNERCGYQAVQDLRDHVSTEPRPQPAYARTQTRNQQYLCVAG